MAKQKTPIKIRKETGLNQYDFWRVLGVTQSGGSRYENGRTMPKPVKLLFQLVYVDDIEDAIRNIGKMKESVNHG